MGNYKSKKVQETILESTTDIVNTYDFNSSNESNFILNNKTELDIKNINTFALCGDMESYGSIEIGSITQEVEANISLTFDDSSQNQFFSELTRVMDETIDEKVTYEGGKFDEEEQNTLIDRTKTLLRNNLTSTWANEANTLISNSGKITIQDVCTTEKIVIDDIQQVIRVQILNSVNKAVEMLLKNDEVAEFLSETVVETKSESALANTVNNTMMYAAIAGGVVALGAVIYVLMKRK